MKTLDNQIFGVALQELSSAELDQISGGSWLSDVAGAIGFAIGYTAHAVIDAVLLVTGNFGDHN